MIDEIKYFTLDKKIIAYKTTESWAAVPHVSFIYEADITNLLFEYNRLNKNPGGHITLNTLFLKIITEAVKAAPQVNAHIKYNSKYVTGKIETVKEINISMPWLLENGETITVNLKDFGTKSLNEMQSYVNKIRENIQNCNVHIPLRAVCVDNLLSDLKKGRFLKTLRVLTGTVFGKSKIPKCKKADIKKYKKLPAKDKITAGDLVPGTITVSNIGSLYKDQKGFLGLLEIIPPQIFAVGIGAAQEKAGVIMGENNEKKIGIVKTVPICLAFDHRALNFSDIVPFLQKLDYIFGHSGLFLRL